MNIPKIEIKKILYATDLSETALQAFAYTVNLACLYDARITILHTLHEAPDVAARYIGKEAWAEIKQRHVDEARSALIGKRQQHKLVQAVLEQFSDQANEAFEDCRPVVDDIIVVEGKPEDEILRHAEEKNCDLIVMGTRGHGIIAEALIGSTARRVIRAAKIPVFIVPITEK
jgi:nucleotide-binding universal stress UspA family protein